MSIDRKNGELPANIEDNNKLEEFILYEPENKTLRDKLHNRIMKEENSNIRPEHPIKEKYRHIIHYLILKSYTKSSIFTELEFLLDNTKNDSEPVLYFKHPSEPILYILDKYDKKLSQKFVNKDLIPQLTSKYYSGTYLLEQNIPCEDNDIHNTIKFAREILHKYLDSISHDNIVKLHERITEWDEAVTNFEESNRPKQNTFPKFFKIIT